MDGSLESWLVGIRSEFLHDKSRDQLMDFLCRGQG